MKYSYDCTMRACFTGYIVQAIVNNFVPLLFLTFQRTYHIPLQQITLLVTFNFGIQLLTDLLSIAFVDRMGYRASMVLAHILSALADGIARADGTPICRNPNFGHCLRCGRRTSGGAGKPCCGGLSLHTQRKGHEYAAFFLLLGTCWCGTFLKHFFQTCRD